MRITHIVDSYRSLVPSIGAMERAHKYKHSLINNGYCLKYVHIYKNVCLYTRRKCPSFVSHKKKKKKQFRCSYNIIYIIQWWYLLRWYGWNHSKNKIFLFIDGYQMRWEYFFLVVFVQQFAIFWMRSECFFCENCNNSYI